MRAAPQPRRKVFSTGSPRSPGSALVICPSSGQVTTAAIAPIATATRAVSRRTGKRGTLTSGIAGLRHRSTPTFWRRRPWPAEASGGSWRRRLGRCHNQRIHTNTGSRRAGAARRAGRRVRSFDKGNLMSSDSGETTVVRTIGRYRVSGELGRGAMGVVYKGFDPLIGRTVALKTLSIDNTDAQAREFRDRLYREAAAAGALSHPNIVTIFDIIEAGGLTAIAMEFIEGRPLSAIVTERAPLPIDLAVEILDQICAALDYAGSQGIVHRDIKPANILVTSAGRAKVTDFGVARLALSTMTQAGTVLGSPSYMSPEQVKGLSLDGRSDLFSAAVVFFEMITRERPFAGNDIATTMYRIAHEAPTPPTHFNPEIGPGVAAVLERAFAKSPADRFQTGADLVAALRAAASLGSTRGTSPALAAFATAPPPVPPIVTPIADAPATASAARAGRPCGCGADSRHEQRRAGGVRRPRARADSGACVAGRCRGKPGDLECRTPGDSAAARGGRTGCRRGRSPRPGRRKAAGRSHRARGGADCSGAWSSSRGLAGAIYRARTARPRTVAAPAAMPAVESPSAADAGAAGAVATPDVTVPPPRRSGRGHACAAAGGAPWQPGAASAERYRSAPGSRPRQAGPAAAPTPPTPACRDSGQRGIGCQPRRLTGPIDRAGTRLPDERGGREAGSPDAGGAGLPAGRGGPEGAGRGGAAGPRGCGRPAADHQGPPRVAEVRAARRRGHGVGAPVDVQAGHEGRSAGRVLVQPGRAVPAFAIRAPTGNATGRQPAGCRPESSAPVAGGAIRRCRPAG